MIMSWFKIFLSIISMLAFVNCVYATDKFLIKSSCGGGITATHSINSIDQDGVVSREVISFVLSSNNKKNEIIGNITAKNAQKIYTQLLEIDFLNIKYNKGANYSCSLHLVVDGAEHIVSWPGGMIEPNSNLPRKMDTELQPVLKIHKEISVLLDPIYKELIATENKQKSGK